MLFGLALVLMMLLRPEGSSRARSARPSCRARLGAPGVSANGAAGPRDGDGPGDPRSSQGDPALRRPGRRQRRRLLDRGEVDRQPDRPERRRQDDVLPQSDRYLQRPSGEITFKGQRLDTIAPHRSPAGDHTDVPEHPSVLHDERPRETSWSGCHAAEGAPDPGGARAPERAREERWNSRAPMRCWSSWRPRRLRDLGQEPAVRRSAPPRDRGPSRRADPACWTSRRPGCTRRSGTR